MHARPIGYDRLHECLWKVQREHFKSTFFFFFDSFSPDLRRFVSAHPNQEVERFIGGDAEVTLGFYPANEESSLAFALIVRY